MTIWSKIQKSSKTGTWNKGKQCKDSVYSSFQDEKELELIVVHKKIEYEVYIGLEDEEWDCSCSSRAQVLNAWWEYSFCLTQIRSGSW